MTSKQTIEGTMQTAQGIAQLAKDLGYTEQWEQLYFPNGSSATNLIEFLDDNPGACAALIEWVLENGCFRDGGEIPDDEEDCDDEGCEED